VYNIQAPLLLRLPIVFSGRKDTVRLMVADDADKQSQPATPTRAVDTLAVLVPAIADSRQDSKLEQIEGIPSLVIHWPRDLL